MANIITQLDHLKNLKHVRELLTHPAIDQHEVQRRVRQIFQEAGYFRHPYRFELPRVFRAASKDSESWFNEPDSKIANVQKLHCPPDAIATLQRCNWAGDPVFYCSSENAVPVFEVRAKLEQTVVISGWVNKRNIDDSNQYPITFYGLAVGVKRILPFLKGDSSLKALLLKDDVFNPSTPTVIKEIDEYVGELFAESAEKLSTITNENQNLYWFTSAIARVLLNDIRNSERNTGLDGLIYPSVESKFTGVNVAFHKNFARTHLKLLGAAMYKVVEYQPAQSWYSLKPLKGLANDRVSHEPIWRNIHPKHDRDRFTFSPDTPIQSAENVDYLSYED